MTRYDKLVRDRIPELIRVQGEIPYIRTLDDAEYASLLETKLDEEVAEFHADKSPEELADILEVVFALAKNAGVSYDQLMEIYQRKHEARGGFDKRIYLMGKDG